MGPGSKEEKKPRRPVKALDAIRPFKWRIAFTYTLTFAEDLLELSYPWATGYAIDGLLEHNYWHSLPIVVAWSLRALIGLVRKMYDTRLYTSIYNVIAESTIVRQRSLGVPATQVAARTTMSREFVTFFDTEIPVVITSLIGIVGSAVLLFTYDLTIGMVVSALLVPVLVLNRLYATRSYGYNKQLNNQLEREVDVIDAGAREGVAQHLNVVRRWRVKLSDAEAVNWSIVEILCIASFLFLIWRASALDMEAGEIFAVITYAWQLMEKLDNVPVIVQQVARLVDIGKRIEGGASVQSIGEEIERTEQEIERAPSLKE